MIDLNNIFSNFENTDKETDDFSLLIDFSEHPLFWIGGFNKIINNCIFFKQYTVKNWGITSPDLDIDEIAKVGEDLMFNRAWGYIKNIDVNNHFHMDCIKIKATELLIKSLEESIKHFESLEDYHKCALLTKIKNKVNEFLP